MSNYPDNFKGTNMDRRDDDYHEGEIAEPVWTDEKLGFKPKHHHINPLGLPTNPASFKKGDL